MNKQGFTLIEVVVVMAIIAVLAALVVGAIQIARKTAKETQRRNDIKTIQTSLEAYYGNNKKYPDTNSGGNAKTLFDTVSDITDALGSQYIDTSDLSLDSSSSRICLRTGGYGLTNQQYLLRLDNTDDADATCNGSITCTNNQLTDPTPSPGHTEECFDML